MEAIYQLANESKLNFNVQKGDALHKVWRSLWDQCEAANERLEGRKTCFPKPSNKSTSNVLKMLTVFQNEVNRRGFDSRSSDGETWSDDLGESCGPSKSKQKLPEDNYDRRGKTNEYLSQSSKVRPGKQPPYEPYAYEEELDEEEPRGTNGQVPKTIAFVKQRTPYHQERENPTTILVQLLPNFTKYDPDKDPVTNMSLFEDECSQHNLASRESCLMMKLWLPSQMSVRLTSPVARPACGSQFWSSDDHWGDRQDRLKALVFLATGEDDFGIDILEDLKVTPRDDPWEFSRKFEQAYRLVMGFKDSRLPPAMLKALLNKFTFLDCATRIAASKERTVDGIVRIVDKYRRNCGVKQRGMMVDQFSTTLCQGSMADQPETLWSQLPQDTSCDAEERPEDLHVESDQAVFSRREETSVLISLLRDPDISEHPTKFSRNAVKQNQKF